MRAGLTASTLLHAGVIVLTLVSFTGAKPFEPMTETVPVDVVSFSEFTKMTRGTKTAPKADVPKQVAEKVDVPTPVEDPKLKVADKPPVEATAPPPPPPPPPPPKVDQQPAPPKAADAPPPKEQAEVALKPEPKKEEKPKDEPKQEAAAVPVPPRKPAIPREQPKPVDSQEQSKPQVLDDVAKLLDKRTPQRQAAASSQVSTTGSLGSQTGTSATLSASVIDALKSRINSCWHPPGIPFDQRVEVLVNFKLQRDGSVAAQPRVSSTNPPGSPYAQAYAESGIRAIVACGPYSFLPQAQYDAWSDIDFNFTSDDARQLTARR